MTDFTVPGKFKLALTSTQRTPLSIEISATIKKKKPVISFKSNHEKIIIQIKFCMFTEPVSLMYTPIIEGCSYSEELI